MAAIYLDLGIAVAHDWLLSVAGPELADPADAAAYLAPKGRLQMLAQAAHGQPPQYRVVALEGPDHARHFVVEVLVDGRVMGRGEGSSRRAAETGRRTRRSSGWGSSPGRRRPRRDRRGPSAQPAGRRLQVLRRADHPGVRTRHLGHRRPQRQWQEQPRRRAALGPGRAGPHAAHPPLRGRHLRRVGDAPGHRPGRGHA